MKKIDNLTKIMRTEKKKRKLKMDNILRIVSSLIEQSEEQEVRKHPVYAVIKALANYHLYDVVSNLYAGEDVTDVQELFEDIGRYLNNQCYNKNTIDTIECKLRVDLAKDAVLVCAWNRERLVNALLTIGKDVGNPFVHQDTNHFATYMYPIGLTVVHNGNHSSLTGILKSEGEILPSETYDLTPAYDSFYFDGTYFRKIENNEIVHIVNRFELGVIYEIGRLLAGKNIR